MKILDVFANPNPKSFCHAWVWIQRRRTIPKPGFKTIAQVQENIREVDFGHLNDEQMNKIDDVFECAGFLLGL